MVFGLLAENDTSRSPALKPPLHGVMPPPCHAPDLPPSAAVGQAKSVSRWWNRMRPQSTSPNALTTLVRPALILKRRLSSAWPLPLVGLTDTGQVPTVTSEPGHSTEPSPPVNPSS